MKLFSHKAKIFSPSLMSRSIDKCITFTMCRVQTSAVWETSLESKYEALNLSCLFFSLVLINGHGLIARFDGL